MFGQNLINYCNDDCIACPFNINDISENAYNLGCLPSISKILDIKRQFNFNWACHDDANKICAGYVAAAKDHGLNYKNGSLLNTDLFLRTGKLEAV